MKKTWLLLSLLIFALGNCNTSTESESRVGSHAVSGPGPTADNARTPQHSLNHTGTYTGVLPCADCPGIETEITLGADNSFVKKTTYLGKSEGSPFEKKGRYRWDASGRIITLEGLDAPNQYLVGKNRLTQLDRAGKKVEGGLASLYVLEK